MENLSLETIVKKCDMCGAVSIIELNEQELICFEKYLREGGYIQECLPNLNRCEREFLKTGMCRHCQELIFGNGRSKRVKP